MLAKKKFLDTGAIANELDGLSPQYLSDQPDLQILEWTGLTATSCCVSANKFIVALTCGVNISKGFLLDIGVVANKLGGCPHSFLANIGVD
jgi:hypothetical protein